MLSPPRAPSNYLGTRLSICGALGLIVTGFFLCYDAIVHRGIPSLPSSQKSYQEVASYPAERRWWEVKAPDMESPGVAFAKADVPPLAAEVPLAQNLHQNL